RAPADRELSDRVLHAVQDGFGERLRLVDGRHRLWLVADLLPVAVELRRIDRARQDERDGHLGALLLELDARRLEERATGRLRGAVRGLERDAAVRERRGNVQDGALALLQVRERGPEAVDHAEEVHVEDAPELVRLEALGLGIDRDDRVRAVRVDAAEAVDRLLDHLCDLVLDRVVGRDGERLRARRLDLGDGVVERLRASRGPDDLRSALACETRDRAAEAARGARDDDDLLVQGFLSHRLLRLPRRV